MRGGRAAGARPGGRRVRPGSRWSGSRSCPTRGRTGPRSPAPCWTRIDVVVVAPRGRVLDGDVRRLAARARQRGAVLVPYGAVRWPGAERRLSTAGGGWEGLGEGSGHLRARLVVVRGEGRGAAARARELRLWLPAPGGGVGAEPTPLLRAVPDLPPAPSPAASTPRRPTPRARAGAGRAGAGGARGSPLHAVPAPSGAAGPVPDRPAPVRDRPPRRLPDRARTRPRTGPPTGRLRIGRPRTGRAGAGPPTPSGRCPRAVRAVSRGRGWRLPGAAAPGRGPTRDPPRDPPGIPPRCWPASRPASALPRPPAGWPRDDGCAPRWSAARTGRWSAR